MDAMHRHTSRRLEQIDQVREAARKADAKADKYAAWNDAELAGRYRDLAANLKWLAVTLARRADRQRRALEALQKARVVAGVEDADFETV